MLPIPKCSIHQFNKTAIFKCVLPYHQTMKFLKMISLTKLKGSGLWEFLEPVLLSGSPLSRGDLVSRIVADRNLLIFIMDMVKEAVASRQAYRMLFGFYMTTLLEAINKHGLSEYMLRDMWPYIIAGLASSDENYQAATIMVLSTACWKATIAPQLIRGAIDTLIAHTPPHLHSNAIRALIMIVQNSVLSSQMSTGNNKNASKDQSSASASTPDLARSNAFVANIISEDTLSVLSSWTDAAQILSGFMQTQSYDTTTLMSFLLTKLAEDIGRDATRGAFLTKLFSSIDVPELVPGLTVTLLHTYSAHGTSNATESAKSGLSIKKNKKRADDDHEDSIDDDEEEDDEHEEANIGERLAQLMAAIDIKYPTQLDQGIANMLQTHPSETRWQDLFEKGRHHGVQIQSESGAAVSTTLTLCLRETLPATQIFALSKLLDLSSSGAADAKTRDLLQSTLLEHLRSNQPQLVLNALEVSRLGDFVEAEELFHALENLTFFSSGEVATKAFSIAISLFLNPASSASDPKSTPAGKKKAKAKDASAETSAASNNVLSITNAASKLMPMILYALFCPEESMRKIAGPAALRFHQHFLGRTPAEPCQTVFSHYSSSLANESTSAAHSILALAESAVANDDYSSSESSWHSIGANPRARTVFLLVLGCALSQVALRKIQPHPSRTVEQECLNLAIVLLSHFSNDLHTMLLSVDMAADASVYAATMADVTPSESRVAGVPDWQPAQLQSLLGSTPYFRRELFCRYIVWALLNLTASLANVATPGAASDHLISVSQNAFKLLASAQVPSLFAPHFKTLIGFIGSDIHVANFLEHMWVTPQATSCNTSHTVILSPEVIANADFLIGQHGSSTSALVCMRALAFLHSLLNSRVQYFASHTELRDSYHDFAARLASSLLVPLAHSDSGVRVAALSCLSATGQLLQATQGAAPASTPSKKGGKKVAANGNPASSSAFATLISEIVAKRSEFALSESTLTFAIERFFQQDSSRDEDSHTGVSRADRQALQTQLLTNALSLPTTFAKYVLLHTFLGTPCGDKLDLTASLFKDVTKALTSTEGPASSTSLSADSDLFTFYLLDTLVRQWQGDCAQALNASDSHFALLITALRTSLETKITLDPTIASHINPNTSEKVAINSAEARSKVIQSEYHFSLQLACLAQISPEFFSSLSAKNQSQLFEALCDLVLSPSLPVKDAVQSVLRSIAVDPSTIVNELQACVEKTAPVAALDTAPPAKRSKSELSSTPSSLHPTAAPVEKTWIARVTVLLEMLQYKPDAIRMGAHYVPALFSLLRNTAETDNALAQDASAEYIEQLIFTTLINITEGIANGRAAVASGAPSTPSRKSEKMQIDGEDEQDAGAHDIEEQIEDEALRIQLDKAEFTALQSKYDVDCIIQIIRIRSNPTLQNNALLLLSHIARIYPGKVMAHVMSIFSFMGASTERSDDTYTFNVIEKTVERVIPALLHHSPGVEGRVSASALVAVFVDRIDSIPQHRRLMLFYHLLTKILRRGYLALALTLLLHRQANQAALDKAGFIAPASAASSAAVVAAAEPVSMSAFALALFQKLTPYECISAIVYTLYWLYGFEAKLEHSPLTSSRAKELTATDKANMRGDVIQFALSYVTSRVFISQLLELPSEEQQRMQNAYLALFQALLVFAKFVSSSSPQGSANALLDSIYKLTDRVNELMSIYTFFDAMGALFKQNDATIKHRALILFNERIKAVAKAERAGFDFGEKTTVDFIQFTMNLFQTVFSPAAEEALANGDSSNPNDNAFTIALNKQTAALSVEIVARLFGYKEEHQSIFVQLANLVIGALSPYVDRYNQHQTQMAEYHAQLQRQTQESSTKKGRRNSGINLPVPPTAEPASETAIKIQASLIVALATLVSNVRERLLPLVNKFFPLILGTLRCAISLDASKDPRQLLRQSCLAALHVCIGVMHRFLSQYWPQILQLLLQPTDVFYGTAHWDGVVAILQLIGEVVPARLLIDPLETTFTHILEHPVENGVDAETFDKRRSACVQLLAKMTGQVAAGLDRTTVQSHHQQVFRVFLRFFEYSELTIASPNANPTYASLVAVEESVIRAFMQLTLKLNETLFKPLFLVLLDWAKIQASAAAAISGNASELAPIYSPRTHFFYRLVYSLAEELKGIFVPYFSYIMEHAVRIVLQPAHSIKKGDPLLKSANVFTLSPSGALGGFLVHQQVSVVLNGLQKLFLYDRDGFMDKSRFDRVMNPIVDQLDCCYIEHYKSRVTHSIVPCLAQLAVCVGNEALWKPLNHNVLNKARHSDAQVRFSVLLVIGEFYHRSGEAFLPLLHESAQTFAELLEDSNPEVERQCLALIKQIEAVLGEDGGVMALLSK